MTRSGRSSDGSADENTYLAEAASLISKKWYPVIIRVLLDAGSLGFNDLQTRLEPISAKVLTDALDELQETDLVERRVISESPLRVEYSLTSRGEELQATIQSLADWGERHLAEDAGPPTVLVADDDRRLAEMHTEWLERDYDVRVAYDGDETVKILDGDVDLVVLDRRMPGLSGDELVEWIRRNNLDCRIVVLTSQDPDTDIVDLEFDEYLTKPTDKSKILDVVDTVLDRREHGALVREYLALRSKQALLKTELGYEDRDENEEYRRLVTRIEELETEIDEVPESVLRPIVTEDAS
ncbi:MAG: winged helix-turn-helix transcriptional regulator [Halobellus sp.]|uniref:winged helix-turn-helix transcriptional regulator n=1 Tax=Halobellus sp. TaxID=1979212 RepID=UPI0035D4857E